MMIALGALRRGGLQLKCTAGYIHLEDSTQKINLPKKPMSFNNPTIIRKEEPQRFIIPDTNRIRKIIKQRKFRHYRDKMIGSSKPTFEYDLPDELWGVTSEYRPKHYYRKLSNAELFQIPGQTRTRNLPQPLRSKQELVKKLDLNNLSQYTNSDLLQISLKLRADSDVDRSKWFQIEQSLKKQLGFLRPLELIQLKYSFSGPPKFGSIKTHTVLNDLILQDLDNLDLEGLLSAYCAFRLQKREIFQKSIIDRIVSKHLKQINSSPANLTKFLQIFTLFKRPNYLKPFQNRQHNEYRTQIQDVLDKLSLKQVCPQLSVEESVKWLRALHTSKAVGYKHIGLLIDKKINDNIETIPAQFIPEIVFLLGKIEGGEGVIRIQTLNALRDPLLSNWQTYSDYWKLKAIYSYWNVDEWEEFRQLYAAIPITQDVNHLYYQTQIELIDPSGRQTQLLKAVALFDIIPLPYHYKIKQFCIHMVMQQNNYDVEMVYDKIEQTDDAFDALRHKYNLAKDSDFVQLGKFLALVKDYRFKSIVPVFNTECVHYSQEDLRISIGAIHPKELLQHKKGFKKSYQAHLKTLKNCGWYSIAINWSSFLNLSINERYSWIVNELNAAVEAQTKLIQEEDYAKRNEIVGLSLVRQQALYAPHDYEAFEIAKQLQKHRWDYVPGKEDQKSSQTTIKLPKMPRM